MPQAPILITALRQLQPAAVITEPQGAEPALALGTACLRDALGASARHLRSEAAAPGFVAMAAAVAEAPTAASSGAGDRCTFQAEIILYTSKCKVPSCG